MRKLSSALTNCSWTWPLLWSSLRSWPPTSTAQPRHPCQTRRPSTRCCSPLRETWTPRTETTWQPTSRFASSVMPLLPHYAACFRVGKPIPPCPTLLWLAANPCQAGAIVQVGDREPTWYCPAGLSCVHIALRRRARGQRRPQGHLRRPPGVVPCPQWAAH